MYTAHWITNSEIGFRMKCVYYPEITNNSVSVHFKSK